MSVMASHLYTVVQSKCCWVWVALHNRPGDQQSHCSWQACGPTYITVIVDRLQGQGTQGAVVTSNGYIQTLCACIQPAARLTTTLP